MTEFLKSIKKQDIRNVLAVIATVFAFGYLVALTFLEIPERNKDVVNTLSGVLIGGTVVTVYNYFFGNSKKQTDVESGKDTE